jgi:hypothetical protein
VGVEVMGAWLVAGDGLIIFRGSGPK